MKTSKHALWTFTGAFAVLIGLGLARPASGQFGIDLGLILSTLTQLNSTMASEVAPPLATTATVASQVNSFEQNTLYPVSQISQTMQQARQVLQVMQTSTNLFSHPLNSATLPQTQALESQLLGGNANNIGSIAANYIQVYGSVPSSTAISSDLRPVVDMSDAQAQAALKKAIQLDAIAQQEEQLSQQFMQELGSASPGAAALVDAQAAAWNLQAHAYTQAGLAELLRVESAETSMSGAGIKHDANIHANAALQLKLPLN